jgi:ABC-type lipoprotein export system ATPase subunit
MKYGRMTVVASSLCKIYQIGNAKEALKDVNLKVRESEFAVIRGLSGAGKTTLLNVIGGVDMYTS